MIKELNEFAKELKLYRESNTLPQGDVKNKLADIYEANFKVKWGLRKVDRGCPTCISDMMKCLCAEWYDSLNDFKAVPVQRDLEDQIAEEEKPMPSDYHDLDTAGLIDLCDTLGIKYHHKNKKATLIKKLDKYFND